MKRTIIDGLTFAVLLYGAALGGVLFAHTAHAEDCDPATTEQCCACELAGAAEPAPLPRLYLPSVMHMPRMSAEYTPYVPAPTVTPEAPVTGDVTQEDAQ